MSQHWKPKKRFFKQSSDCVTFVEYVFEFVSFCYASQPMWYHRFYFSSRVSRIDSGTSARNVLEQLLRLVELELCDQNIGYSPGKPRPPKSYPFTAGKCSHCQPQMPLCVNCCSRTLFIDALGWARMKTYLSPGLEALKPAENKQMLITVAGT